MVTNMVEVVKYFLFLALLMSPQGLLYLLRMAVAGVAVLVWYISVCRGDSVVVLYFEDKSTIHTAGFTLYNIISINGLRKQF